MNMSPELNELERISPEQFVRFFGCYCELVFKKWVAMGRGRGERARPLTLDFLRRTGATDRMLIWMQHQGHIEHLFCPEGMSNGAARPIDRVVPERGSCFVLTDFGAVFVDQFLMDVLFPDDDSVFHAAWCMLLAGSVNPRYDASSRTFSWGRELLKHFRQPAGSQDIVLQTAEELAWPVWFDDPLPGDRQTNAKIRLHNCINDLNRRQRRHLIHFKGDGTGTRLGWEFR